MMGFAGRCPQKVQDAEVQLRICVSWEATATEPYLEWIYCLD